MTTRIDSRAGLHPGRRRTDAPARQRLRLCIAAISFYPVYGGGAVRFARYLPGFEERGLDVTVFTGTPTAMKARLSGLDRPWQAVRPGEWLPDGEVFGVPVHRVRLPDEGGLRRSFWFHRRLLDLCRDPGTRPDVIQLVSLSLMSMPVLHAIRRLGVRVVFTKTMLARIPKNPIRRALLARHLRTPVRAVDRVVASTGAMRDQLERLGVRPPIDVIPNGVDVRRFRPPSDDGERMKAREPLGIGAKDTVVAFVGPISPRKGVDRILAAWTPVARKHPRVRLVLVGPRRDAADPEHRDFHRRLNELVDGSGAADRIHFVGLVENPEDYLRAADVFAFASSREGMPNVVLEAMASGLPVVTTPFIGLSREFGCPSEHYLRADFATDSLAAALDRLVRDASLRSRLGAAARAWVTDTQAVEHSLDGYVSLYRQLITSDR